MPGPKGTITCPKCGLWNPESTNSCDCGYAFKGKETINIKAIIWGTLIDQGASLILGIVGGVFLVVWGTRQGVPMADLANLAKGQGFLIYSIVIGLGNTLLGGYVAGRIAKKAQIFHGALIGGVGILVGIIFVVISPHGFPLWFNIISFLGVVPAGMAGGSLAATQSQKPKI